jgi:putative transposase
MKSSKFARLKTNNHSAYRLFYHLLLSTKYRHKCITGEMLERLEEIFKDLLLKWHCELIEFGGGPMKLYKIGQPWQNEHFYCQ